jgi:hypothetical protein
MSLLFLAIFGTHRFPFRRVPCLCRHGAGGATNRNNSPAAKKDCGWNGISRWIRI